MGGDVREMLLVFWHLVLLVWYELPARVNSPRSRLQ